VNPFTIYSYESYTPVSAGIGVFNASVINYYDSQVQLQLLAFTQIPSLFYEPFWTYPMASSASSTCSNPELQCVSYLFVGGVEVIAPYPNNFLATQSTEADTIVVYGEQGVQVDYWELNSSDSNFTEADCQTWATTSGEFGFVLCIKESDLDRNNLVAGNSPLAISFDFSDIILQPRGFIHP